MDKSRLKFEYPEHLVATERKPISRVMWVEHGRPSEVTLDHVLTQISPEDVLVINETKVIPARVFSESGMEILFVEALGDNRWRVLCPARRWKDGAVEALPGGVEARLIERGKPQVVELSKNIDESYFFEFGDMPLPPYIQQARGERRSSAHDRTMYQTDWANVVGSLAAPTASLHFSRGHLEKLRLRGGQVETICLHVGLGTFLPVTASNLNDHRMHFEAVNIPRDTWERILACKQQGGRVWALGSTVTRALEAQGQKPFPLHEGVYSGETDLFIKPGFEYKIVDVLMTNFHQPESTLLAMVMAFAGEQTTLDCYHWAMERQFRLFSYGDLSVWTK